MNKLLNIICFPFFTVSFWERKGRAQLASLQLLGGLFLRFSARLRMYLPFLFMQFTRGKIYMYIPSTLCTWFPFFYPDSSPFLLWLFTFKASLLYESSISPILLGNKKKMKRVKKNSLRLLSWITYRYFFFSILQNHLEKSNVVFLGGGPWVYDKNQHLNSSIWIYIFFISTGL